MFYILFFTHCSVLMGLGSLWLHVKRCRSKELAKDEKVEEGGKALDSGSGSVVVSQLLMIADKAVG